MTINTRGLPPVSYVRGLAVQVPELLDFPEDINLGETLGIFARIDGAVRTTKQLAVGAEWFLGAQYGRQWLTQPSGGGELADVISFSDYQR